MNFVRAHSFHEDPLRDNLAPPTPLQIEYNRLSTQLRELERDNPTDRKITTIGVAVILDVALELIHARIMAHYSPEYLYGHDLSESSEVKNILGNYLLYSFRHGHLPALAIGFATWFSENSTGLPTLGTQDSLSHIATIAAGFAAGYGALFLRMKTQIGYRYRGDPFYSSTKQLLGRLEDRAKSPLIAADHLDVGKHLLQAAAITAMVTWGFIKRTQKEATINDLRNSLILARDRLQRESKLRASKAEELKLKKEIQLPKVEDILREKLENSELQQATMTQ
ncbi:hypothetical protein [Sansalvadorimonas verongulae]|uniref:hypothetical protein n=1 Tax=Sansalvadorimonas verongulae TaxID=2172824 RepID=UPI0012BC9E42|nr:hypothetical protein [Sansalvadorimonas verongulae]MTI15280.1 hypothetical protein [Sansalvadorimonas verongulae]